MSKPYELYGRPWSEREYLMALDVYFQLRTRPRHKEVEEVKDLSRVMGRTPAAIAMRLENFASLDYENRDGRLGLANMSALGMKLFLEWSPKPRELEKCVGVLRRDAEQNWSEKRTLFDMDPVALPKAFGKYELLDCVGQGSFGSVYSCVNIDTEERNAIKIIHSARIHDREPLHRFFREIRALKQVENPHVVTLREDNLDDEESFPAFVMELADSSLTDYANALYEKKQRRPLLEPAEAIKIIRHMVSALAALHLRRPKIVHRDLNPNNILQVSDGNWVLADFGLVKFIGTAAMSTSFQTKTERGMGTGYYTAPEQYQDLKRTDERVDIYSLGILVWELFSTSFPPPDTRDSGLPPGLNEVFVRATMRSPEARYASIGEFQEAFESTAAAVCCPE